MPTFKKVEMPEKKVKRIRGKKEKNWLFVEKEYFDGADQVLSMTAAEKLGRTHDEDEIYNEETYVVVCTLCNKEFKTNIEASSHFSKMH